METKSASILLSDKIQFLKKQQDFQEQLLKEQFNLTYERLQPINLLKSSLERFISAPPMLDNVIGTTIGLVTGHLFNKIVVGGSGGLIRRLLGLFLQVGVRTSVEQRPDVIRSIRQFIYQYFLKRKENKL